MNQTISRHTTWNAAEAFLMNETFQFITDHRDIHSVFTLLNTKQDVREIFRIISDAVTDTDVSFRFPSPSTFVFHTNTMLITVNGRSHDLFSTNRNEVYEHRITVYADQQRAIALLNTIKERCTEEARQNYVTWRYRVGNDIKTATVKVECESIHDEFYPYLDGGYRRFIDSYIADKAAVLILYGRPGTGKTSFLRNLIVEGERNAVVSYDKDLIDSDEFMASFMVSDTHDLLIVEDADVLLTARDRGNVSMDKFLNMGDGLVKMDRKKIIFTTNLNNISQIDDALLRPGRCFAAVEFRSLTGAEAAAAAQAAGMPDRDWSQKKDWPLCEVFAQPTAPGNVVRMGRVGFGFSG